MEMIYQLLQIAGIAFLVVPGIILGMGAMEYLYQDWKLKGGR